MERKYQRIFIAQYKNIFQWANVKQSAAAGFQNDLLLIICDGRVDDVSLTDSRVKTNPKVSHLLNTIKHEKIDLTTSLDSTNVSSDSYFSAIASKINQHANEQTEIYFISMKNKQEQIRKKLNIYRGTTSLKKLQMERNIFLSDPNGEAIKLVERSAHISSTDQKRKNGNEVFKTENKINHKKENQNEEKITNNATSITNPSGEDEVDLWIEEEDSNDNENIYAETILKNPIDDRENTDIPFEEEPELPFGEEPEVIEEEPELPFGEEPEVIEEEPELPFGEEPDAIEEKAELPFVEESEVIKKVPDSFIESNDMQQINDAEDNLHLQNESQRKENANERYETELNTSEQTFNAEPDPNIEDEDDLSETITFLVSEEDSEEKPLDKPIAHQKSKSKSNSKKNDKNKNASIKIDIPENSKWIEDTSKFVTAQPASPILNKIPALKDTAEKPEAQKEPETIEETTENETIESKTDEEVYQEYLEKQKQEGKVLAAKIKSRERKILDIDTSQIQPVFEPTDLDKKMWKAEQFLLDIAISHIKELMEPNEYTLGLKEYIEMLKLFYTADNFESFAQSWHVKFPKYIITFCLPGDEVFALMEMVTKRLIRSLNLFRNSGSYETSVAFLIEIYAKELLSFFVKHIQSNQDLEKELPLFVKKKLTGLLYLGNASKNTIEYLNRWNLIYKDYKLIITEKEFPLFIYPLCHDGVKILRFLEKYDL